MHCGGSKSCLLLSHTASLVLCFVFFFFSFSLSTAQVCTAYSWSFGFWQSQQDTAPYWHECHFVQVSCGISGILDSMLKTQLWNISNIEQEQNNQCRLDIYLCLLNVWHLKVSTVDCFVLVFPRYFWGSKTKQPASTTMSASPKWAWSIWLAQNEPVPQMPKGHGCEKALTSIAHSLL